MCFDKDELFYLGRTGSKGRRDSRPTCCRCSMHAATSALAGCSLHCPGQRVILLWMNLLRALQSYSSFRNSARGTVMEQCPWDFASTHHLASSIHPTVWEAPVWHRLLCEQQKLLEGLCFLCKCPWNFIHVCASDGNTYLLQWMLHALLVPVTIPLEV